MIGSNPYFYIYFQCVRAKLATKNALYIPVNEGGGGRVTQLYFIAGYNERGLSTFWNTEEKIHLMKLSNRQNCQLT
jgi:hypothetical protein